jgi:alpha-N-acetylglucosamine transferase
MTQYDKLVFLDSDIMILKNLDHLFECEHMTSALDGEYFNLWPDDPHFNSGILVIEPNEDEYNRLIDYINNFSFDSWQKYQCIAD